MSRPADPRAPRTAVRRQVCAALAAATAGPFLAGCLGGPTAGPAESRPQGAAPKRPVALSWSPWDGEGQAIIDGATRGVEQYRRTHPNVSVELSPPSRDDFDTKISAMIAADAGPDVFGGNGAAWRERARQGQFVALDPLIKRDLKAPQLGDYVEAQYRVYSYPGVGQFALPMYMATFALFYNKGVFRERGVGPPDDTWDWTKWQDAMQRLTVRPDAFGAWLLTFSRSRANMLVLQNGGHFVDPKDDTVCVADQPACIDALQWLNDRYWRDHTAMQQADAQAAGGTGDATLEQLFSTGKVAMFMHGSFRLAPMTLEVQPGVEWDCAVLPKGKVKRSSRASTDGWGIWKGSKNPDDAWDFMKWLQGDDWYDIMMGTVGLTPARVSQVDKWTQAIGREYPALAGKNLRAFTDPIRQRWAEPEEFFRVHKDAADILDAAFTDSVRDNKTSVAAAMTEAAKRITDVERQLAGR